MRLVVTSDTHGDHKKLGTLPDGDLLIHCGDFQDQSYDERTFLNFIDWMASQPHRDKLVVPGNHDGIVDIGGWNRPDEVLKRVKHAQERGVTIKSLDRVVIGKVSFGCYSYTPKFMAWHFQNEDVLQAQERLMHLSTKVDVLVSHGPSYGFMDQNYAGVHSGCKALREWVCAYKPKYHFYGHIHEAYGHGKFGDTEVYCASFLDGSYNVANKPHVVDICV